MCECTIYEKAKSSIITIDVTEEYKRYLHSLIIEYGPSNIRDYSNQADRLFKEILSGIFETEISGTRGSEYLYLDRDCNIDYGSARDTFKKYLYDVMKMYTSKYTDISQYSFDFVHYQGRYLIHLFGVKEENGGSSDIKGKVLDIKLHLTKEILIIIPSIDDLKCFDDAFKEEIIDKLNAYLFKGISWESTTMDSTIRQRVVGYVLNKMTEDLTIRMIALSDIEAIQVNIDTTCGFSVRLRIIGKE
jgi:hypothetical protein